MSALNAHIATSHAEDYKVGSDVSYGNRSLQTIKVEWDVVNHTGQPITIARRDGLKYTVPTTFDHLHQSNKLKVRSTYSIPSHLDREISEQLSRDATVCDDVKRLWEARQQTCLTNAVGITQFYLEYLIDLKTLKTREGAIYFTNLDLMISTHGIERAPAHPYTNSAVVERLVNRDLIGQTVTDGFNLQIVIIDNEGKYDDKFININGSVYRIPVRRDATMLSGVWVSGSNCVDTGDGHRDAVRYDTSACINPGDGNPGFLLFDSSEKAKALGDVFAAQERAIQKSKAEMAEREQRLKDERSRQEHELKKQKLEDEEEARKKRMKFDEYVAELEFERKEFEHQRAMASLDRKDYHEDRSYRRKDTSETIKMAPTLITGAMALFALIRSF